MKIKKGEWVIILFNLIYVIVFAVYYLSIRNFEFLWYVGVLLFFFLLILLTIRKTNFDLPILWGLSIWGFLHMAGGGIKIGEGVLYKVILLPIVNNGDGLTILKFDQAVHIFGFFVATLVVYHILKPHISLKANWKVIYFVLIAAGTGLGALNEMVEFIAVLIFPETGVGGYNNTSLDLISNLVGASLATLFIHLRRND